METQVIEYNELIATRQAPGDRWSLVGEEKIYNSLTEVLDAWFEKNQKKADFRLSPLDSKLYVIQTKNKKPEPPKRFNIYGDSE
jgi:hypothetical protein